MYGKTLQNVKKHKNIRIINTEEKLLTYTTKPTFRTAMEIDQDLFLIHLLKDLTGLKRPIYIGQVVLDLSKLRMYELYYEQLLGYSQDLGGEINILGVIRIHCSSN